MASIEEFYRDQQIFITGGTGFVGKLLVSKLLLSCPKIEKIVLLIRKKENECIKNRLDNLFEDEVFDTLKKEYPLFRGKVELVVGDCEQKNLGLSHVNRFMITQRITVIFHCAANVEFDRDLKTELNVNVNGALEIITIARSTRNLKALIYVSSSYSNSHLPVVEEKYYEINIDYKTLLRLAESDIVNENEKSILGPIKSTYFFSKAVAEQVIIKEGKKLPIAIFRPSAIISTWKEPIAGWINKAFAPTAIIKSLALGRYTSMYCTDNVIIDMVPADLTVNALISVGWDINIRYTNDNLPEPRFYNYVSMVDNALTFKQFLIKCYGIIKQKPSAQAIWYPTLSIHKSRFTNTLCSLTRPWLLAGMIYLWSCVCRNENSKYRMLKTCQIYVLLTKLLNNIIQAPHIYLNDNIHELWHDMSKTDQNIFFFDLKQFNWDDYLKTYYDGILQFILKEQDRNEKVIRKRLIMLQIVHTSVKILFYVGIFLLLQALFQ